MSPDATLFPTECGSVAALHSQVDPRRSASITWIAPSGPRLILGEVWLCIHSTQSRFMFFQHCQDDGLSGACVLAPGSATQRQPRSLRSQSPPEEEPESIATTKISDEYGPDSLTTALRQEPSASNSNPQKTGSTHPANATSSVLFESSAFLRLDCST